MIVIYFVYEINFNNNEKYVGCTNNLRRRKDQHNENIRKRKGKLGKYLASNYDDIYIDESDLKIIASFSNRKEALIYEKEITAKYDKEKFFLLNDNYTKDCTRKGKNIGNTSKEYCIIDVVNKTYEYINNLRQYSITKGLSYKSLQDTVNKTHIHKNRYKVFLLEDWKEISDKNYFISGKFLEDINSKLKLKQIKRNSKTYKILTPNNEIMIVENLDKFAKDNNINPGNLHASLTTNKKAQGYLVLERI